MNNTDGIHKLNVFISSKCGGEYSIARKALKKLLESTGLVEVYVFEEEPASSEDTQSAYLEAVDQANLCIFLIDNFDGASPAVLSEEKRAKDKQLRLLYIFCDEKKREPTPMQEAIRTSLSQKYFVVHEFSDMVPKAYDSVMKDIITVYKRKNELFYSEKQHENVAPDKEKINTEAYTLPSCISDKFPHVYKVLTNNIFPNDPEEKEKEEAESLLEKSLAKQLEVVLFQKKPDEEIVDNICTEVLKKHGEELHDLLKCRFNAQKYYYKAQYDECLIQLQAAIKIAIEKTNVPEWIANDIAIDIRNIHTRIDEQNSKYSHSNPGQNYIDASSEPVYFPYLDRQVKTMQQEITKEYYDLLTISPYTIQFGGFEEMFTALSSAFCIAEMFGSIIQVEITRDRLLSIYSLICTFFNEHELIVEYVRLMVVNRETKKIDTTIRTYNQPINLLNGSDIKVILDSIDTIPDPLHRIMSKYLLCSRLGYYIDNTTYPSFYNELMEYAMSWVCDDHRIYAANVYIFDFFKRNTLRAKIDDISDFICAVFDHGLVRFYMDCFKILNNLDFSTITEPAQEKIEHILLNAALKEEEEYHCYDYFRVVIRFCISATISYAALESVLKQKYPDFYRTMFALEITAHRENNYYEIIQSNLKDARHRNSTQGVNGVYSGFGYENFDIIYNILSREKMELETDMLYNIINVIVETLAAKRQTAGAKLSAIKLLQLIYFQSKQDEIWKKISQNLIENIALFSSGNETSSFSKDHNCCLSFQYDLFISNFDKFYQELSLEKLFSLNSNESYDIIQFLKIIDAYLETAKDMPQNENLLLAFLYYSISMLQNKEIDIRYYATKCLISLTHYSVSKKLALMCLNKMMDTGSEEIKVAIITRTNKIHSDDDSYLEQIINKGKADSNYLVQYMAQRESSGI